jgi:prepilin-type N-terminal cleavage/methylation domain-containing protein
MKVIARKSRAGFSLIEILTVVGAIAVLGAATFGVVLGVNTAVKNAKRADVANQLQTVAAQAAAAKGVSFLDSTDFPTLITTGISVQIGGSPVVFKLQTPPSEGTFTYSISTGAVVPTAVGAGVLATGT